MPIKNMTPSGKATKSAPMAKKKAMPKEMPSASANKMKEAYGSKPPKMGPKTKKTLGAALMAAPVAVIGAVKMINERQKRKDPLRHRDTGLGSYNKKK